MIRFFLILLFIFFVLLAKADSTKKKICNERLIESTTQPHNSINNKNKVLESTAEDAFFDIEEENFILKLIFVRSRLDERRVSA